MDVNELFDAAKAVTGSDNKTAAILEINQPRIPKMRRGKEKMPPTVAAKLADLIGADRIRVIGEIEARWAARKDPAYWKGKVFAAVIAGMLIGAMFPQTSQASQILSQQSGPDYTLCAFGVARWLAQSDASMHWFCSGGDMQTQELRAPARRPAPTPRAAERWYNDPLVVCAVAVGSIVTAAALIWLGVELRARYELRQLEAATLEAAERFQESLQRVPTTERRTVTVPSKSVEDCKAETGGLVNEHFARCRRGYQYTETIRR